MPKTSDLLFFLKESINLRFVLKTIIFSTLFLGIAAVVINIVNIISALSFNYPLLVKTKLIFIYIGGTFQSITDIDIIFLTLISVLFGANLTLVLAKLKFVRKQNNLRLTFGAGIISIAAAGCATCGLSLMSIIGLAGVLAILPLHGIEFYILAVIILILSFIYNLNSIYKACKIRK
ncbi:MAG TPA: hypothetical protein VHE53_04880 [Patescibacteria group bacterium]|nr:hypothetical protein [Patescibacteria group bacterium]